MRSRSLGAYFRTSGAQLRDVLEQLVSPLKEHIAFRLLKILDDKHRVNNCAYEGDYQGDNCDVQHETKLEANQDKVKEKSPSCLPLKEVLCTKFIAKSADN